jgi:hypothetical protein
LVNFDGPPAAAVADLDPSDKDARQNALRHALAYFAMACPNEDGEQRDTTPEISLGEAAVLYRTMQDLVRRNPEDRDLLLSLLRVATDQVPLPPRNTGLEEKVPSPEVLTEPKTLEEILLDYYVREAEATNGDSADNFHGISINGFRGHVEQESGQSGDDMTYWRFHSARERLAERLTEISGKEFTWTQSGKTKARRFKLSILTDETSHSDVSPTTLRDYSEQLRAHTDDSAAIPASEGQLPLSTTSDNDGADAKSSVLVAVTEGRTSLEPVEKPADESGQDKEKLTPARIRTLAVRLIELSFGARDHTYLTKGTDPDRYGFGDEHYISLKEIGKHIETTLDKKSLIFKLIRDTAIEILDLAGIKATWDKEGDKRGAKYKLIRSNLSKTAKSTDSEPSRGLYYGDDDAIEKILFTGSGIIDPPPENDDDNAQVEPSSPPATQGQPAQTGRDVETQLPDTGPAEEPSGPSEPTERVPHPEDSSGKSVRNTDGHGELAVEHEPSPSRELKVKKAIELLAMQFSDTLIGVDNEGSRKVLRDALDAEIAERFKTTAIEEIRERRNDVIGRAQALLREQGHKGEIKSTKKDDDPKDIGYEFRRSKKEIERHRLSYTLTPEGEEVIVSVGNSARTRIQLTSNQQIAMAALRSSGGEPSIIKTLHNNIPDIADINRTGLTIALDDLKKFFPGLIVKIVPTGRSQLTKWGYNKDLLKVLRKR